ncbi:MAG: transposase [Pseudomonas sp.]
MIQYPAELPLPLQEGYGLATVDPMRATPMVTGRTRYRVRHRYIPIDVRVNFNFSEAEAALFEGWYVWAINNGFDWFEMPLQTPMGFKTYIAHFKGIYQGPDLTQVSRWRYSAILQLRDRPIPSQDGYIELALGMPLDQFNAQLSGDLNKWYTRYFG